MYRHNHLPQRLERQKIRRSIVFSSPKFDKFHQLISLKKLTKSQSRERSVHRIDSKQKPKMLYSPSRKRRNFQISTSAGNRSQTMPFSRYNRPEQSNDSKFISVSDLLQKRGINSTQKIQSFLIYQQRQQQPTLDLKVVRILNPLAKEIDENLNRIKEIQKSLQKINLSEIIEHNFWQIYEGELNQKTNRFQGYGCIIITNGDKFIGFFQQGKPQGHGTYYLNHEYQNVINGIWRKGLLVQIL